MRQLHPLLNGRYESPDQESGKIGFGYESRVSGNIQEGCESLVQRLEETRRALGEALEQNQKLEEIVKTVGQVRVHAKAFFFKS